MFAPVDWLIIIVYIAFAFVIGILMTRKASSSLSSYFVADRTLPWWWLGTSMVATTFAADTPLAITGIVANDGIAGNWFWWSWILMYASMTVFFARRWRSSEVLTDVELIELRYDGDAAKYLRAFKAVFFSVVINCIILGWVFRAMNKITNPFIRWDALLGSETFNTIQSLWPSMLIFGGDVNGTITILIIFVIVVVYSMLGGIRGVILTDLFQFALAIITAVLFAYFAVQHVGGLSNLTISLEQTYPGESSFYTNFMPSFTDGLLPFNVFLIFLLVNWWAQIYSDGSGFYSQRMNTAKTPADAEKGTLWFTFANFGLRTWPWIMVALVALVVFPKNNPTEFFPEGAAVGDDREMAYPILMQLILPAGLLGLTFTSLLAAFMSTVDTHLNWGASYFINDIYQRFINPKATQKTLVRASRIGVILIAAIAIVVASYIGTIEGAWKFFIAIGSGLGMAHILRWVWWRVNAWTEISAMGSSLLLALFLYPMFPDTRAEYMTLIIAVSSVVVSIVATFATPPVSEQQLSKFILRAKPFGFWQNRTLGFDNHRELIRLGVMWVTTVVATFSLMFTIGHFLLLRHSDAVVSLVIFLLSFVGLMYIMNNKNGSNIK